MIEHKEQQISNISDTEISHSILFVDDESNILSSLNRLFRPEGYKIFVATGGAEGLKILENQMIDVVVSDMRTPEMDGAQFLEQVNSVYNMVASPPKVR